MKCASMPPSTVRLAPAACRILATALICGCGDPDPNRQPAIADSSAVHVLADRSAECDDCLTFEELVVLGDTTGPGYVSHTDYIVRDSSGNYWTGQYDDMIKVFDSAGTYLRQVGRQGSGPGEFGMPFPSYVDAIGRVHVLDYRLARETVFAPTFEVDSILSFPPAIAEAIAGPDGSYVANAPYRSTGDGFSDPLHIIEDGAIVESFGRTNAQDQRAYHRIRVVATDASGRVYTAWPFEYEIEMWSSEGRRIAGYKGPSIYEREPVSGGFSRDQPPITRIEALHVDDAERLWVLLREASGDWRNHMREVTLPGGRTTLQPTDVQLIYTSRIDVVDLTTNAIVTRVRPKQDFDMFMGDGSVVESRLLPNGIPQIAVWSVAVTY